MTLEINKKHGGPFDRGGADFYYHRDFDPHYWPQGTGHGTRVEKTDMTLAEQAEYLLCLLYTSPSPRDS